MTILNCDAKLGDSLTSNAQRARVITEAWAARHLFCVECSSDHLLQTPANTKARDFECSLARHAYELKSSAKEFRTQITDGAYSSMIHRIREGTAANLLLLHYSSTWQVREVSVVHRLLLTEEVIQQRKPLAMTARRAGWIGCNIRLSQIPPEGRIPIIQAGEILPREEVRRRYAISNGFGQIDINARGWAASVLSGLRRLGLRRFSTHEAYSLETMLGRMYPNNRNIRPKIRQQLQVLRDLGLLRFEGRGQYSFELEAEDGQF